MVVSEGTGRIAPYRSEPVYQSHSDALIAGVSTWKGKVLKTSIGTLLPHVFSATEKTGRLIVAAVGGNRESSDSGSQQKLLGDCSHDEILY
jgi:hypothetical protein